MPRKAPTQGKRLVKTGESQLCGRGGCRDVHGYCVEEGTAHAWAMPARRRRMRRETIRRVLEASLQHDAFLYAGTADFVDITSAFIRDSVAEHEPMLVVVSAEKIVLLLVELGGDSEGVRFADMALVGQIPARIIP